MPVLLSETYPLVSYPFGLLVELHYLPCIDYMSGVMRFGSVRLETQEHYQKQSYRNRCYVRTANQVDALTVPVQKGTYHQPIRDVRVVAERTWQNQHWRCLKAAYGRAPFFEYYAPEIEPVYQKSWQFLVDLNYELLTICLKLLAIKIPIHLTECYEKTASVSLFDGRSRVNPGNGPETYVFHQPVAYLQNFGQDFVPNLSVIDLLFCQGPAASDVLTAGLRE